MAGRHVELPTGRVRARLSSSRCLDVVNITCLFAAYFRRQAWRKGVTTGQPDTATLKSGSFQDWLRRRASRARAP